MCLLRTYCSFSSLKESIRYKHFQSAAAMLIVEFRSLVNTNG